MQPRETYKISDTRGWSNLPTKKECKEISRKCDEYLRKRGIKVNSIPLSEKDLNEFIENF